MNDHDLDIIRDFLGKKPRPRRSGPYTPPNISDGMALALGYALLLGGMTYVGGTALNWADRYFRSRL